MGKKYIIEIPDDKIGDFVGSTHFLMPYMMAGHIGHHDTGLPIAPYTEPDLEQVRKEAYEEGRKVGIKDGMCDAWEVARKVVGLEIVNRRKVFGTEYMYSILEKNTATEAIDKIRQYEQEKEEQITKGDIVLIKSTPEVEILVTYADEEHVSGIALTEVDDNCEIGDQYTNIRISNVEKTGKHYDIVSVLQKMKETDNG